jgi:hypothetical protein
VEEKLGLRTGLPISLPQIFLASALWKKSLKIVHFLQDFFPEINKAGDCGIPEKRGMRFLPFPCA